MRFLEASILTLSLFYGLTLAQPSTPPSSTDGQLIEGQRLPDGWHVLHLATLEAITPDVNNTTTTLAVREPIKVCESGISKLA